MDFIHTCGFILHRQTPLLGFHPDGNMVTKLPGYALPQCGSMASSVFDNQTLALTYLLFSRDLFSDKADAVTSN